MALEKTLHEHTQASIMRSVEEQDVRFVHLQFTDILGSVKQVVLPASQLAVALTEGVWFDGSSIEGFARVSESDMFLVPDLDSFAIVPWASGAHRTARLICDIYTPNGEPFIGAPRTALRRVLNQAQALGFEYRVATEIEFFIFKTDQAGAPIPGATHDEAGYLDATADQATSLCEKIMTALLALGIPIEAGHHEVAPGQHEIDLGEREALRAADDMATVKHALKAMAQQHGVYATFMPKPIKGISGSGMHIHQSLIDCRTGCNTFGDDSAPYGLAQTAKRFMAGQLYHAKGMMAILAPLVNSYKRFVPGFEAPMYLNWARRNEAALIRVPRAANSACTRLELRGPDPSCNPYLALAAMLQCGLDGVQRELPLPEPMEERPEANRRAQRGLESLPGSLYEALEALKQDTVVQEALGPHIYERFVAARAREWGDYASEVTSWERKRYLYLL